MAAALMREPDEILALSPQAEPMKKDSVEVLLDGMSEPTPNRTKTTPQTDGQASAAYHGAHSVRPPGPRLRDDGPKVLVDRPPTPVTVRVPRSTLEAIGASSSNATVGTAARSAARIWLAFFAGIAVVLAIFAVFYFTSPGEPPSLSALGAAAVTDLGDRPTGGASTSSTSTPGNELPPPQAARAPGADSGGTSTAKAPAPANVSRSTSTQGRRLRPTAPADDLGEFKTAF
jgi:hypothetical protein